MPQGDDDAGAQELTLTWFYDDLSEDYIQFRRQAAPVEQEYQELRQLLAATRRELTAKPGEAELQVKAAYLKKRLQELETKFPWLTREITLEYALWGVPH